MADQYVEYNGFVFDYVKIGYGGTAIYSDDGRTLQGHSLTFRISAFIYAADEVAFQVKLADFNAKMSQARKRFLWRHPDGTEVFDINEANDNISNILDRTYGPSPRIMDVQEIVGGVSARVRVEIEAFVSLCAEAADISEFWWTFNHSLDRNFTLSTTINGKFKVRAGIDVAATLVGNPIYWPPLPKSMYRDSINYTMSNDGLVISYTIVDHQVWRTLPKPLSEGNATYRISQEGAMIHKTLSCSFAAPHDVNKQIIMQFIIALMRARFPQALTIDQVSNASDNEWVQSFEITNHEFENRMDAHIVVRSAAASLRNIDGTGLTLPDSLFGDVADVTPSAGDGWTESNGIAEQRSAAGTIGLIPRTNDPFDVCLEAIGIPVEVSEGVDSDENTNTASQDPSDGFGPIEHESIISDEHRTFPYTSYVEQYQYIIDYKKRRLSVMSSDVSNDAPKDIVQQVSRPCIRVIQVGYARRINTPPVVPLPAYAGDKRTSEDMHLDHHEIKPSAPKLMGDGRTIEYGIGWTYSMIVTGAWALHDQHDTSESTYPYAAAYYPVNRQINLASFMNEYGLNDPAKLAGDSNDQVEPDGIVDQTDRYNT